MNILVGVFLGVIGAAMGSFMGALTWRMKKGSRFWREFWRGGHSICEHCRHELGALDLVPVLSWLFLRGRCRYCGKKIGPMTFWLEISLGLAFVVSYLTWPLGVIWTNSEVDLTQLCLFMLWLVMVVLMAGLLVYDARWQLLPNKLMWPLVGLAAVFAILNNVFVQHLGIGEFLVQIILAMIPVTGIYGLIYLLSRGQWIGFGDVKFGLVVGLLLNWQGALLVLVGANIIGSLVILPLLLLGKMKMTSQMAFGPFLILATFVVFLCGGVVVDFLAKNLLLLS